jgi:hypothetical protein
MTWLKKQVCGSGLVVQSRSGSGSSILAQSNYLLKICLVSIGHGTICYLSVVKNYYKIHFFFLHLILLTLDPCPGIWIPNPEPQSHWIRIQSQIHNPDSVTDTLARRCQYDTSGMQFFEMIIFKGQSQTLIPLRKVPWATWSRASGTAASWGSGEVSSCTEVTSDIQYYRYHRHLTSVLRIRDVLSRIPDPDPTIAPSRIRIPDPGGKKAPDPGSDLY